MEQWVVSLVNSSELKIKAKKKDLFKSEKKYFSVKIDSNGQEEEIFINRQSIVWIKKLSDSQE